MSDYDKDGLIRKLAFAITKVNVARSIPMGTFEYVRAWSEADDALASASTWLEHAPAKYQPPVRLA